MLASTICLSLQMSAPLISMCKSSKQIVRNIGSEDLFEGVSLHTGEGGSKGGGHGAVSRCSEQFVESAGSGQLKAFVVVEAPQALAP